jgi:hypothetical protein
MVVRPGWERISVRSHSSLTSHSPRPVPGWSGRGGWVPASGSLICPWSLIWQMSSLLVAQMVQVPGPGVCLRVLAASSPTDKIRSGIRPEGSGVAMAYWAAKKRTAARSPR